MKGKIVLLSLAAFLVVFAQANAYDEQASTAPAAQEETVVAETAPAVEGPVNVGNKICPVGGETVGAMGEAFQVEYNGKIYNLCCPMCEKDFLKDPAKYSKIAEDEVAGVSAAAPIAE